MSLGMTVEHLHDATLHRIDVLWSDARCRFEFTGGPSLPGKIALDFSGVVSISIPRAEPWGPSASVLEGAQVRRGVWEIRMQSGDTIVVAARAVEVQSAGRSRSGASNTEASEIQLCAQPDLRGHVSFRTGPSRPLAGKHGVSHLSCLSARSSFSATPMPQTLGLCSQMFFVRRSNCFLSRTMTSRGHRGRVGKRRLRRCNRCLVSCRAARYQIGSRFRSCLPLLVQFKRSV